MEVAQKPAISVTLMWTFIKKGRMRITQLWNKIMDNYNQQKHMINIEKHINGQKGWKLIYFCFKVLTQHLRKERRKK